MTLAIAIIALVLSVVSCILLYAIIRAGRETFRVFRERLDNLEVAAEVSHQNHQLHAEHRVAAGSEQENNIRLLVNLSQRIRPLEGRARNLAAARKERDTPPGYVPPEERVNDFWSVVNGKRVRTRGD